MNRESLNTLCVLKDIRKRSSLPESDVKILKLSGLLNILNFSEKSSDYVDSLEINCMLMFIIRELPELPEREEGEGEESELQNAAFSNWNQPRK